MKYQKFVIASDSHGDMIDPKCEKAILEFIKEFKPSIRIHAGDAFDFRNLRKGASDEEKASSLEDDWNMGSEFLRNYFSGGKFNHFLYGNHDTRLKDFCNSTSGLIRDYAYDGVKRMDAMMRKFKARTYPYDSALGIMRLGKLNVVHGYHAGANACRQHAAVYGNCVFGHVHTIESAPVASLEPAEARSIGCMCIRDMEYVNKKTGKLRWGQGWAFGILFEDGSYHIEQARNINGRFVFSTNFIVI
jgi:hypothetical protein